MKAASKSERDKAMRFIIDYYSSNKKNHYISIKSLTVSNTLDSDADYEHLADVLQSLGYITIGSNTDKEAIYLTDKGKIYFETEADESEQLRKQYCHDWKIAIFSAIAGAFFSEPLWFLLRLLHNLFQNRP